MDYACKYSFDPAVVRLACFAYGMLRVLSWDGLSAVAGYAHKSVVAGCSLATTWVVLYTIETYDGLVRAFPSIQLDVYIDDAFLMTSNAEEDEVVKQLDDSAHYLGVQVKEVLECDIAIPKACVIASSQSLATKVAKSIGELAGRAAQAALNLGIGITMGKPRRKLGKLAIKHSRIKKALSRKPRVVRLRQVVPSKVHRIFTAGQRPQASYGVQVLGVDDAELELMQTGC